MKSCQYCTNYATMPNDPPCRDCVEFGSLTMRNFSPIIKKADTREGMPVVVGGSNENIRNYR